MDIEEHPEWEKEESEAFRKAEMERDEAYQEAHPFVPDDQAFYNEHEDSAYQCGKDRDDR
jgi:hypothetical protein